MKRIPLVIATLSALVALFSAEWAVADQNSRFFVKFRNASDKSSNSACLSENGVRTIARFYLTDAVLCEALGDSGVATTALKMDPRIEYVAPDVVFRADTAPDDPLFSQQWALENSGQSGGVPGADISAIAAWAYASTADEVVVGVIDTGVDYNHPDLANQMWVNVNEIPGNGVDDDDNGYIDDIHGCDTYRPNGDPLGGDPMADVTHGSHVAGIIAAQSNNSVGIAGVASNARIMAVKANIHNTIELAGSDILQALDYCALNGADLINASFGRYGTINGDQPMRDAIASLGNLGIAVVAAAGNDHLEMRRVDDADLLHYPACFDLDNVISVAASDISDNLWYLSNYGVEHVDLAAPGSSIISTANGTGYVPMSGTSMATPHVTGAAAIALGLYPELTPVQLKIALMVGATPLDSLTRIVGSGGRLNLSGMLAALDTIPPGPVASMTATGMSGTDVQVRWTATGNDGNVGMAHTYDLRYSESPIVDMNDFESAASRPDIPAPAASGVTETVMVRDLEIATTYYFAIRVRDWGGNWSEISTVSGTTLGSSTLSLDESPRSYSLQSGGIVQGTLMISNSGIHAVRYLPVAVSLGTAKKPSGGVSSAMRAVRSLAGSGAPRVSGRDLVGPHGGDGLYELLVHATAKSSEWGSDFHDDFSADNGFWDAPEFVGTDLWHYTSIAHCSPSQSMAFVNEVTGTYDTGTTLDVGLASLDIDLPAHEGAVSLDFFEWYSTELGYDHCDVEVSVDQGIQWVPVRTGISGDSSGWLRSAIDLSQFSGQSIRIRFRFHTGDALFNDYPGWYIDDVSVRGGSAPWVVLLPGTSVVNANASRPINYQISSSGLCAGEYEANLNVYTDDPANAMFTVPMSLSVASAPDIRVENYLDLGAAYVGHTLERSIVVSNVGCSLMEVTGVTSTSPEISANISASVIPAGSTAELNIAYSPSGQHVASSVVTLTSNDPDTPVTTCLVFGDGMLAPVVAVSDTSYAAQVTGETEHNRSLTISNPGGSDLQWQHIHTSGSPISPATSRRVLVDWDGFAATGTHLNLLAGAGCVVEVVEDPVQGMTQEMLDRADVVEMYHLRSYSAAEISRLAAWVLGGGGIFCSIYQDIYGSFAALLVELGLDMDFVSGDTPVGALTPLVAHAMADGVAAAFGYAPYSIDNLEIPMVSFLKDSSGACVGAFGAAGEGRVFISTVPFYVDNFASSEDNPRLVSNIVNWLAWNGPTLTPASGTIPAGSAQVVDVQFSSVDVAAGAVEYNIALSSNDPARPLVNVAATYEVTGLGRLQLSADSYAFGAVYASRDTSMTIDLWNAGNGALNVLSAVSSNQRVSVSPSFASIVSRAVVPLIVTISPGAQEDVYAEISLTTDVPGQELVVFTVSAHSALPQAVFSARELDFGTMYTGPGASKLFTITNTGVLPMDFQVTPSPFGSTSFSVQGASAGVVGAGQSVDVSFICGNLTSCTSAELARDFEISSLSPTAPDTVTTSMTYVSAPNASGGLTYTIGMAMNSNYSVDIVNTGCGLLTVSELVLSGDSGFSLVSPPQLPVTIAQRSRLQITVHLGEYDPNVGCTAILSASTDDPDRALVTWEFSGLMVPSKPDAKIGVEEPNLIVMPNPFNPSTTLEFAVDRVGYLAVNVYDVRGHLVRRIDVGSAHDGRGSVVWDGRSNHGIAAASGTYFFEILVDGARCGRPCRAVLLK